jgi:hypothetical protein
MKQFWTRLAALVTVAFLSGPSLALSQTKAEPYRPLSNQEMSQQGIWDQWVKTFGEMTGKQKAEVMRRHIKMCLDSFEMTEEQRAFVKEMSAKVATEEVYSTTDPEKRAALQRELQPLQQKAMSVLGPDLAQKILAAKPPISVLEAIKSDPAFK